MPIVVNILINAWGVDALMNWTMGFIKLGVASNLLIQDKCICNVCAKNKTIYYKFSFEKKQYTLHSNNLCHYHISGENHIFKRKFGGVMNTHPKLVTLGGRYWIHRWWHMNKINMPKELRGMKRLLALSTLSYWQVCNVNALWWWYAPIKYDDLAHKHRKNHLCNCVMRDTNFFSGGLHNIH